MALEQLPGDLAVRLADPVGPGHRLAARRPRGPAWPSRPAWPRGSAPTRPQASRPDLPPPAVRFDDAASTTATVVEVHAPDRIGVLYRVTRAFAELDLDIRTAKVQTLGDQVVDAFYVTHTDGALRHRPRPPGRARARPAPRRRR